MYWDSDQVLYCSVPYEYNAKKGWCGWVDVFLVDKEGKNEMYLFEIVNYNVAEEINATTLTWDTVDTKKSDFYTKKNPAEVANKPLYMNETFYLKTFKAITKKDVINCVRYYIHKILEMNMIWNFKMKEETNGRK